MMTIDDAGLLQANATVIIGILIFITIAPVSKEKDKKLLEKRDVLFSIVATLGFLATSVFFLLFNPFNINNDLFITKVLFFAGLFILPATVFFIMSKLQKVKTIQHDDEK
jgi:multisubunit Na+/H+ antiporter MnhB subunit